LGRPEMAMKVNKYTKKPQLCRRNRFVLDSYVLGPECFWGKLKKRYDTIIHHVKLDFIPFCSVRLKAIRGKNLSADSMYTADPYVKIQQYEWDTQPRKHQPVLWKSSVQHGTLNPEWQFERKNKKLEIHLSPFAGAQMKVKQACNIFDAEFMKPLKFSMWAYDKISGHDFMGRFEIEPSCIFALQKFLRKRRKSRKRKEKAKKRKEERKEKEEEEEDERNNEETHEEEKMWITVVCPLHSGEEKTRHKAKPKEKERFNRNVTGSMIVTLRVGRFFYKQNP